jgi:hypothetical protein
MKEHIATPSNLTRRSESPRGSRDTKPKAEVAGDAKNGPFWGFGGTSKAAKIIPAVLLSLSLAVPMELAYGKDKDGSTKTKHSSSAKKKKGKSKDKGIVIKVENDKQTGPMEDVSSQTEVSQQPGQDAGSGKGKSKKSKN